MQENISLTFEESLGGSLKYLKNVIFNFCKKKISL